MTPVPSNSAIRWLNGPPVARPADCLSVQCYFAFLAWATVMVLAGNFASAQQPLPFTISEQRTLSLPDFDSVAPAALPDVGTPYTVASPVQNLQPQYLTLDEAIRIGLENARVVRFLGGVAASTSGRTIYDVAITNTAIDVQNALFDPTISLNSTLNKSDRGTAVFDPANPGQSLLAGSSTDSVTTSVGLAKRMYNGASAGLNLTPAGSFFSPGIAPLDPLFTSGVEMTLRQPLLRGYGRAANLAPVVVARIDTGRSYFQYKDAVQEHVRGVINGYWALVSARVAVWAREQQVEQAEFAFERAEARQEEGLGRAADVALARSALANFRASLIAARSNLILSETALRNLLGLPPSSTSEIVPVSLPVRERVDFDWAFLMAMAERQRPDIIELKLILEADRQLLLQATNQARPVLDGIANYRWDGLQGEMPNGTTLRSGPGQFAGWNVGVNFSVPVGLRQGRATMRRQELVICRDQANLEQGLHQMIHQLTVNYRNVAQFYEQIDAFGEARRAALLNYENQFGDFQAGRQNFLNVLTAITDWGNAVAQEAAAVTQYNSELANVERQSGTILESHGIVFFEERYSSLGPLGRLGEDRIYPSALRATDDQGSRYPDSGKPADESFDLNDLGSIIRDPDSPDATATPDENGERQSPSEPDATDLPDSSDRETRRNARPEFERETARPFSTLRHIFR